MMKRTNFIKTNNLIIVFIIYISYISLSDANAWWTDGSSYDDSSCSCDDKVFDVSLTSSYTRHDITFGYDIYCYTYVVTRSEDYNQHQKCTEEIDFVTLGVSTNECNDDIEDLQHIIVEYGASELYNCTTSLMRDDKYDILGLRYECDYAPYHDVNIYLCTTIPDTIEDGHIVYVSDPHYGYSCNAPIVPNFCGKTLSPGYHPPPVIYPTPKPTWPTIQPSPAPTNAPSEFPTPEPTPIPTMAPSIAPTAWPTKSPTYNPTQDPTQFPTPEPTNKPTQSPNMNSFSFDQCPDSFNSDVIILHDTSCFNGLNQCNDDQREFVAEIFSSIIGPNNLARAAWIRCDAFNTFIDIPFDDPFYDRFGYDDSNEFVQQPISEQNADILYNRIRQLPYTNTGGTVDLQTCLDEAYNHFEIVARSDHLGRSKKIIIISNNYLNNIQQANICGNNALRLRTGSNNPLRGDNKKGYDVMMLNFGDSAPLNYISCLVQYDITKLFYAPIVRLQPELFSMIPQIQDEICSHPTSSPTIDPTQDPTTNPTNNPTIDPTIDPTNNPTYQPSNDPTIDPTQNPTFDPSQDPTEDPTNNPTINPSNNPTKDPTNDPTIDPTIDPSNNPTINPTSAPSISPTPAPSNNPSPAPTDWPTPSPNMAACENGGKLDVVFCVDSSFPLTTRQCQDRNEFTGELYTAIKGSNNIVRAAYIRFGADINDTTIDISFDDQINTELPPFQSRMNDIYNLIRTRDCLTSEYIQDDSIDTNINQGGNVLIDTDGPDLQSCLNQAYKQFDVIGNSDVEGRDKKIIIINNNYISQNEQQTICNDNQIKIRTGSFNPTRNDNKEAIGVSMINLGESPSNYISCLVDYDPNRLFIEPELTFDSMVNLIEPCRDEICSAPTPVPTIDPTNDPTIDPTINPTNDPTHDPTSDPTLDPTNDPTPDPTKDPTMDPTIDPTNDPTPDPTNDPTKDPTSNPTNNPTNNPTFDPTIDPTKDPTADPTADPSIDPTNDPTSEPTDNPTFMPSISPTQEACQLSTSFDIAIIVDNSCALTQDECYIQRDQIAELLTRIKAENEFDNPKVTYIEYNSQGAIVRVSLDNVMQVNVRSYFDFIRNQGTCGDGGNGQTDLVSGLDAALREFELYGNPGAVKKIITINNCRNAVINNNMNGNITINQNDSGEEEEEIDYEDDTICVTIANKMHQRGIDGYVINIPAPHGRASNIITDPANYLTCLTDNNPNRVYSTQRDPNNDIITQQEYIDAFDQCQPGICSIPTISPTPDPTNDPTNNPSKWPTISPTIDPTNDPTIDPTQDPTIDPTTDPTPDPTNDPTIDPTIDPSNDPTPDPTNDPTKDPTPAPTNIPTISPTKEPTPSPNMEACENGGYLDVVFCIDTSLETTSNTECAAQNEFAAELFTAVKGANNIVRAGYIRFGAKVIGSRPIVDIALNQSPYNIRDQFPKQQDINILYNDIRDNTCITTSGSIPDLDSCIAEAINQFDNIANSDGIDININNDSQDNDNISSLKQRDKKIVIINNQYLSSSLQDELCIKYENKLRTGLNGINPKRSDQISGGINSINVIMINLRSNAPLNYMTCLTDWDDQRIFNVPIVNFNSELENIIIPCREEICSAPTPSPTTDPTNDPTSNPTINPTYNPTISPSYDPTIDPTSNPTIDPTSDPTINPSYHPTLSPSTNPTYNPTIPPSYDPTNDPTSDPTRDPTPKPTLKPTVSPTPKPTRWPTNPPTPKPTLWPTRAPTPKPSHDPTPAPTDRPTKITQSPTFSPTNNQTTLTPTKDPTTLSPSNAPTQSPTESPSISPSQSPSMWPTNSPLITQQPSWPTFKPTSTNLPSEWPTPEPTPNPSTNLPSKWPTMWPTQFPSPEPTIKPTNTPIINCPICLADGDDDNTINPYIDDYKGYIVELKSPKDIQFGANPIGLNNIINGHSNMMNNVLYKNHYQHLNDKNSDNIHVDYSSISYILVLLIVSCNVIACSWCILKPDKKELIMGYISGQSQQKHHKHHIHHSQQKTLDECDVTDTDSDIDDDDDDGDYDHNDEYRTSTDDESDIN